jgi:predicted outer membrane repeat protein
MIVERDGRAGFRARAQGTPVALGMERSAHPNHEEAMFEARKTFAAAAVAFATLTANQAFAFTRYVDVSAGADDTSCVDPALPCETIAHAVALSLSGDEIVLAPGDYLEHDIQVLVPMTIRGDGAGVTMDAESLGRHFRISANGAVTLDQMTLINGDRPQSDGGSVLVVSGSLVATNATFENNSAVRGGAIACVGKDSANDETYCSALTIRRSDFTGNVAEDYGGAVFTQARTEIKNTDLQENNSGALGGAIEVDGLSHADGSLTTFDVECVDNQTDGGGGCVHLAYARGTFHRTTIARNVAGTTGGGVCGSSSGGYATNLINSTVSDNEAGATGGVSGEELLLANATLVNNMSTGGVQALAGTFVEMRNSIVHDDNPQIGLLTLCTAFTQLSGENNLIETLCTSPGGVPADFSLGAITSGSLGTLADNGGLTSTHALLLGSNAIDAGIDDCIGLNSPLIQDQRGEVRPAMAACDIGAYEWQPPILNPPVFGFPADPKRGL